MLFQHKAANCPRPLLALLVVNKDILALRYVVPSPLAVS